MFRLDSPSHLPCPRRDGATSAARRLVLCLGLLLAGVAPAVLAQSSSCTRGALEASVSGDGWGPMTLTEGQNGDVLAASTQAAGLHISSTRVWVRSFCWIDITMGLKPYVSDDSLGWGTGRAFGSFTAPRAGLMSVSVGWNAEELLSGAHNGQPGPQVVVKVDGIEIPESQIRQTTVSIEVLSMRVGPGVHSLELAARNVPAPFRPSHYSLQARALLTLALDPPRIGTVTDVNRFGEPGAGLAGVGVRLLSNESLIASTTTSADGGFNFTDIDTAQLFDLQLDKDNLVRTYKAVSLSSLSTVPLTLPVTLRARLDAELVKLETTPTLVLAYDTVAARRLTQDWNVAQPELPQVHAHRDRALARLQVGTEGLSGLLTETVPVATDTAKVTVDTITSLLSVRKVMDEIGSEAARRGAALAGEALGPAALRRLVLGLEFIVTALELGSDKLQAAVVDAVKSVLPAWAADLFEQSLKLTVTTVLEAFSSGAWNAGDARSGLLEGITTELAAQIGGRVLASGYVLQTNEDLTIAGIKARRLDGSDAVVDAFGVVQTGVSNVAISHQELIALNAALGDTAKGWGTVADLSLLVGRRPGGQLIAAIGAVVKGVSAGALTGLSVANYLALYETAFEHAPAAVRDAFGVAAAKSSIALPRAPSSREVFTKVLAPSYAERLVALRGAIAGNDEAIWVELGELLLAAGTELDASIELERLRLLAVADESAPAALVPALAQVFGAEGVLVGERIVLYAHLAGLLEPAFADETVTRAQILAQFDAVSAALAQLESTLATARTEAQGLIAPASIFVATHGLEHPTARTEIGPGPFVLRAEVINAGDEMASGLSVGLELSTLPHSPNLVLLDSPIQALNALAPGERRTLRWRGEFRFAGGAETTVVASYRIAPELAAGNVEAVVGGFALVPGKERIFRSTFEP